MCFDANWKAMIIVGNMFELGFFVCLVAPNFVVRRLIFLGRLDFIIKDDA